MVNDGIAWQQVDDIMIICHVCQSAGLFAWSFQIKKEMHNFADCGASLACSQARVFFV